MEHIIFPCINRIFFFISSLWGEGHRYFIYHLAVLQTFIIRPVSEWSWAKPPTPEVVCLSVYLISQGAEDSFRKLQSFTILSVCVIPLSSLSIPCGAQWEKPEKRTVLYYVELYFYIQFFKKMDVFFGLFVLRKWIVNVCACLFVWICHSFNLYVWLVLNVSALVCV